MFKTLIRRRPSPPPPAVPPAAGIEAADAAERAEEPLRGCGWFDSSHELQSGLRVTEHASADAVAGELPLADWLHLHLGGWREPCAA